jgi:peptidoglycan/LPS O-acetylase OafA/YrhL
MNEDKVLSKHYFNGLDSLRILLAIVVLLSHFENVYAEALKKSAFALVKYTGVLLANLFDGTAAVIAFFIISGFVIHYPNKKGILNIRDFYLKRYVRILIPFCVIWLIGIEFNHPESNVSWSLFCEMLFYAFYPFISKIKLSWHYKITIAFLLSETLIIILCRNDIMSLFKQSNLNYSGYYWQLGNLLTWIIGLPSWLLGVIIAESIDFKNQASLKRLVLYRCLVIVISFLCCVAKFHLFLSYILSMNFLAVLLFQWLQTEIIYYKSHPPNKALERLGKFSYSLYICHPLIYLLLRLYLPNNFFTYPIFVFLSISVSWVFYLLVEKPSHRLAQLAVKRQRFF